MLLLPIPRNDLRDSDNSIQTLRCFGLNGIHTCGVSPNGKSLKRNVIFFYRQWRFSSNNVPLYNIWSHCGCGYTVSLQREASISDSCSQQYCVASWKRFCLGYLGMHNGPRVWVNDGWLFPSLYFFLTLAISPELAPAVPKYLLEVLACIYLHLRKFAFDSTPS